MANKYLDLTGLTYFWSKIKTWVQNYAKITTVENNSTITIGNATLTPVLKDGNKVLSDNNFTDNLKSKLEGIESGAEVNVNADWNAVSGDAQILNKPSIPANTSDLNNDAGFITISDVPEGVAASSSTPLMDGATASVGTETAFARGDHQHPSDTSKVDANTAITGATKTKITYDSKGLVTAGADLVEADIPSLHLSKITDVTATAAEVNVLDGITATTADLNKTSGIAAGAEVNQNAFSNVKVGSTTIAADSKTDTIEIIAGSNITITPDATNDQITISATDTTYTPASETPLMDGTGAVGTSAKYAREDHVHPSDTSRVSTSTTVNGHALSSNVTVTKGDVGLGDVTNDAQVKRSEMGVANGVATLNSGGKIPSEQLPSYVDDIIEAYARTGQTALSSTWLATGSASGTVITPESGVIYILMEVSGDYSANTQFRWGGSAYVKINDGGISAITTSEVDTITDS